MLGTSFYRKLLFCVLFAGILLAVGGRMLVKFKDEVPQQVASYLVPGTRVKTSAATQLAINLNFKQNYFNFNFMCYVLFFLLAAGLKKT